MHCFFSVFLHSFPCLCLFCLCSLIFRYFNPVFLAIIYSIFGFHYVFCFCACLLHASFLVMPHSLFFPLLLIYFSGYFVPSFVLTFCVLYFCFLSFIFATFCFFYIVRSLFVRDSCSFLLFSSFVVPCCLFFLCFFLSLLPSFWQSSSYSAKFVLPLFSLQG